MRLHPLTLSLSAIGLALLLVHPAEAAKKRKYHHHAAVSVNTGIQYAPNTVWYGNEYLGADPDPRIRHELLRDLTAHFGGNF